MSCQTYTATHNQAGLYAIHSLGGPAAASANICFQLEICGRLDVSAFRRAFALVAQANDALRTYFRLVDRVLWASVEPIVALPCIEHDLSALDDDLKGLALEELVTQDAARLFELSAAPLARAQIVRLSPERGRLLFAFHHLIADGVSGGLFARALARAYQDIVAQRPPDRAPVPSMQMSDVASLERDALANGSFEQAIKGWQHKLSGSTHFPQLPIGPSAGALKSLLGLTVTVELSPSLAQKVRRAARTVKTSPFVVLLAGVKLLLYRATGIRDATIFSTFANRKGSHDAIGYLVNPLPLRDVVSPGLGFAAFLRQVDATARHARETAHVPSALIARVCLGPQSPSPAPFPLLNLLVDSPPTEYEQAGRLELPEMTLRLVSARSPMPAHTVVSFSIRAEGIRLTVRHLAGPGEQFALEQMAGAFGALLEEGLDRPEAPLEELQWMTLGERGRIRGLSQGEELLAPVIAPDELLRAQARRTPEAPALVANHLRLTYRELHERVDAAACSLLAHGIESGQFVAVSCTGAAAVVAILAALKVGAPWVCVDAHQGRSRLRRLLSLCEPAAVCVDVASRSLLGDMCSQATLLDAEQLLWSEPTPGLAPPECRLPSLESLAYAVFTSGTSGEPKLVAVGRRALAFQLTSLRQTGMFGETPRMLLLAPLTFDASLEQFLMPLSCGGCVVIPDASTLANPSRLWELLVSEEINVFDSVPSLIRMLLPSAPKAPSLQRFVLGGEPLSRGLVTDLTSTFPSCLVYDTYGPTEATINACYSRRDASPANIGRPLPGTQAFVLDGAGQLCPAGITGQLALGGPCLAQGYYGDQGGTAAAFVPSPWAPAQKLYLTGDRARWDADGRLELLGREDLQIKLRGVRIDLNEVEAALRQCEGVEDAVASKQELSGRDVLVAVFSSRSVGDPQVLRAQLSELLPAKMIPDIFIRQANLPKTASGKVDRKAVVFSVVPPSSGSAGGAAGDRQGLLCGLMGEALGLSSPIGPDDDFFSLGGDSLAVVALVTRAAERGLSLLAEDVATYRTPSRLAAQLCQGSPAPTEPPSLDQAEIALGRWSDEWERPVANLLLTGATGLLGIHLLAELLGQSSARVVCLVRGAGEREATERLEGAWSRAFPGRPFDRARVEVVRGDLERSDLGLSEVARQMASRVDSVLHCGGKVDWAAARAVLEETNVAGTRRMTAFAREIGARFHYVSTASVVHAAARNLPYVASKVLAEHVVLGAGVAAKIWRVGLLSGRATDGTFPVDGEQNGLLLSLSACLRQESLPIQLGSCALELTPVDVCAHFMVGLLLKASVVPALLVLQSDRPVALTVIHGLRGSLKPPSNRRVPLELLTELLGGLAEDDSAAQRSTKALLEAAGMRWPVLGLEYLHQFIDRFAEQSRVSTPTR